MHESPHQKSHFHVRRALWLLTATALTACLPAPRPGEPAEDPAFESVQSPLTGAIEYDPSCPASVRPFLDKAAQFGRIAASSDAFRACIANLRTGTPGFGAPYMPQCIPTDPLASAAADAQVNALLPLTHIENPLTMACDFSPSNPCEGNACAGETDHTNEVFTWTRWLQDTFNQPPPPTDPWWPTTQAAGLIWHEVMHNYGYNHPKTCSAPGYNFQSNTVPYIVQTCLSAVLGSSGVQCGSPTQCGPDALPIITTPVLGPQTCTCVKDPRVGTVVPDSGFESQLGSTFSAPWTSEGPDSKGVDINRGLAHRGKNNAFIRPGNTASRNWNAITQKLNVLPNTDYVVSAYVQSSPGFPQGFFGVRRGSDGTVLAETSYSSMATYNKQEVFFSSGPETSVTIFGGYWAPGFDSWIRLDDVKLRPRLPVNRGFDQQTSSGIVLPWQPEGPDAKGVDVGRGFGHLGTPNNAWINPASSASTSWNAIKQTVKVEPNTNYVLTGFVQGTTNIVNGFFGVRAGSSASVLAEKKFSAGSTYAPLGVAFNSGQNSTLTIFAGYWAPGSSSFLRLDSFSLSVDD